MVDHGGAKRIVKEKWEKGKNVIRDDVHKSDPIPKIPSKPPSRMQAIHVTGLKKREP